MSLFSVFGCSDIWNLADTEETVPLRASQFLEVVNHLTVSVMFKHKQTLPFWVTVHLP